MDIHIYMDKIHIHVHSFDSHPSREKRLTCHSQTGFTRYLFQGVSACSHRNNPDYSTCRKCSLDLLPKFSSNMATLHHQLVYRLQNHALDLPTPQTTSDALMILTNSSESIPSIVQIPRHIQKQELLKLMPLEWLSNYEKFHQNSQPVQTTDAYFEKRADGTVKLTFQSPSTSQTPIVSHPPSKQSISRNSFSYSSMITAVSTAQENLPIHVFTSDGYSIYPEKINEEDNDDFNRRPKRRKKKSHKLDPCHKKLHLPPDDPDSLTPLPIYRKGLRLCKQEANQPILHLTPIQSCMMFSSSSYQDQFPPLEKQTDPRTKVTTKPFIHSPVTSNGQLEEPKSFEAILNWQTQNVRAQNLAFKSLDEKIEKVAFQVKQTYTKTNNNLLSPTFSTYQPFYMPSTSRQPVDYAKFFGLSHLKHTSTPAHPKPRSRSTKNQSPPTYHPTLTVLDPELSPKLSQES
ncbi:hypothetical protein KPL71_026416 [Citrus sinensis]|uniref:Uncharacterized protein n=1 Tax=Citrus sinensis TaxID=2711 RepID=A0ACB8HZD6_CITSI|nr:hypothetical protein KPL71_026416 [Citrus sinensis]